MKPISYYTTNPLSFPSKKDYTTVYAYLSGRVLWQGSARDWPNAKDVLTSGYVAEMVVDEEGLTAARRAYGSEQTRLEKEFKQDLFELHGVTGHPKAERCYALAWERSHSSGLEEVANCFDDFVDLIKD